MTLCTACRNTGVVYVQRAWYCKIHDPRVRAERKKKRDAEFTAERVDQDQILNDMQALATRLGCGRPYYLVGFGTARSASGYRRALVIEEADVLKLLAYVTAEG